jgi:hypothetical protein
MKKKKKIILAVLLMIAIGNYSRLSGGENIRTIQFLSIFVMGALSALLINEFFTLFTTKRE